MLSQSATWLAACCTRRGASRRPGRRSRVQKMNEHARIGGDTRVSGGEPASAPREAASPGKLSLTGRLAPATGKGGGQGAVVEAAIAGKDDGGDPEAAAAPAPQLRMAV